MKKFVRLSGVCTALFVVCSVGVTQEVIKPLGLLIRAGFFVPSTGEASVDSKGWITGGAEMSLAGLGLKVPGFGVNTELTFSIDTYNNAGFSSIPILLNVVTKSGDFHITGGAGVSFAKRAGFTSATRFSYQIGAGYTMGAATPIVFEVRWRSVEGVGSTLDGFCFTVGVKL